MGNGSAFWERGGEEIAQPPEAPVEPDSERIIPTAAPVVCSTDGYRPVAADYGMVVLVGANAEASPDLRFVGGLVDVAGDGELRILVGAQSGDVLLRATVRNAAPPMEDDWEDVVEAPFAVDERATVGVSTLHGAPSLLLSAAPGPWRVRVCARDRVDHGGWEPDRPVDHIAVDIWPVDERTDAVIVRQTSAFAAQAVQTYR